MNQFALFVALGVILMAASFGSGPSAGNSAAESAERKLSYIEQNGASARPNPAPTSLQEQEVNAYLASGMVRLPSGVESLRLEGDVGKIVGRARVDFDKVRAGSKNPNPLLSLFSGIHDVVVTATGNGLAGQGKVEVQDVWFDGTEVPKFLVQMFVDKYLAPKYPGVGMISRFALPSRIDRAVIGKHELTVIQK